MIPIYLLTLAVLIFFLCALFYWELFDSYEVVVPFIAAPFLGALGAMIYGAYSWMRLGVWRSVSVSDALGFLGGGGREKMDRATGWKGLDEMSVWLSDINVGWVCLVFGVLCLFCAGYWSSKGADARHVRRLVDAHRAKSADKL